MVSRLAVLAKQAGFRGLFAGLGPRMIMTAGLVSGQFLIYGAIKDGTQGEHMITRKCLDQVDFFSIERSPRC
jgi:hypothetical protein